MRPDERLGLYGPCRTPSSTSASTSAVSTAVLRAPGGPVRTTANTPDGLPSAQPSGGGERFLHGRIDDHLGDLAVANGHLRRAARGARPPRLAFGSGR